MTSKIILCSMPGNLCRGILSTNSREVPTCFVFWEVFSPSIHHAHRPRSEYYTPPKSCSTSRFRQHLRRHLRLEIPLHDPAGHRGGQKPTTCALRHSGVKFQRVSSALATPLATKNFRATCVATPTRAYPGPAAAGLSPPTRQVYHVPHPPVPSVRSSACSPAAPSGPPPPPSPSPPPTPAAPASLVGPGV